MHLPFSMHLIIASCVHVSSQTKLIAAGSLPALLRLSLDNGGAPSGVVRERAIRCGTVWND